MQIRTFACSSRVLGFPLSFRYGKANGSNSLAWENNATPQEEVNKRQICFPRQEVANRFPKVRGNYLYGAWNNTTVAVRKLVRRKVRLECDTNKAIYLLPIGDRAYVSCLGRRVLKVFAIHFQDVAVCRHFLRTCVKTVCEHILNI